MIVHPSHIFLHSKGAVQPAVLQLEVLAGGGKGRHHFGQLLHHAVVVVLGGDGQLLELLQNGLFAVLLAPAINMFPALGEEVGWRGYMMPRLKERFGLLNGRLLGGVVWGIWHWPLMLLVGYEYGTNYLGAPLLGLVVWCVVCFALNTLLDILYEKTESIWVPAIAHGAFNAIAALPQVLVTPADAYYNVLGPMPIGLIAALPMLAAAVWLTLREMKQEEKN